MTKEEIKNYLAKQLNNNEVEIYLDVDDYKIILQALEQEPKTGHWVHGEYCSECGWNIPAYIIARKWQKYMDTTYCPNCGCKMVEPQESEE